jgi:hypothetical protein
VNEVVLYHPTWIRGSIKYYRHIHVYEISSSNAEHTKNETNRERNPCGFIIKKKNVRLQR